MCEKLSLNVLSYICVNLKEINYSDVSNFSWEGPQVSDGTTGN